MTESTAPSREFVAAMNAAGQQFGIDFDWLASQPTEALINDIFSLIDGNPDAYIKKHRAHALEAELNGRPDFRRPRTSQEARVMEWLKAQIERRGKF